MADELVKHYTYDGLGRLIRTQSPYPSAEDNQGVRTERFYYDGVRRIQEVVSDPLESLALAGSSSNAQVQSAASTSQSSQAQAASGEVDESATPLTVEQAQLSGQSQSQNQTPSMSLSRLEREYIWGPGDGVAGVDELVAQFDVERSPWWVVQDGGGDIVALCGSGGAAYVAGQWTYDAYGSVVSADHLSDHPLMHAGHKGLFFDRLDVGVAESGTPGMDEVETPRLVPFAAVVYCNRNRAYHPGLGRFMQMDPRDSAQTVLDRVAYHGSVPSQAIMSMVIAGRAADGASLFQYVRSAPWTKNDPLGLFAEDAALFYADVGFTVGALAADLTSIYAANQESDAEWASDWELPDDFNTRQDASWIAELYSEHDINGYVDDYANPLPFDPSDWVAGRFRGNFLKGSLKIRKIMMGGKLITKGAKHHWFFRMLTRYKKGMKEVVSYLPAGLHRDMHTKIDDRAKALCKGAPSIYNPKGAGEWAKFMKSPGQPDAYFRALRQATLEYFKGKVDDISAIERILDEAGLK